MYKQNEATASCTIAFDPITASPVVLTSSGKEASTFQILGYLFVAGADVLRDIFTGSDDEEMGAEDFAAYLENTKLEVKRDENGNVYLAAGNKNVSEIFERNNSVVADTAFPSPAANITVESKDGKTIYHINNLTVNINIRSVKDMYINPEKVIHILEDKLVDIDQAVMKELQAENDDAPFISSRYL